MQRRQRVVPDVVREALRQGDGLLGGGAPGGRVGPDQQARATGSEGDGVRSAGLSERRAGARRLLEQGQVVGDRGLGEQPLGTTESRGSELVRPAGHPGQLDRLVKGVVGQRDLAVVERERPQPQQPAHPLVAVLDEGQGALQQPDGLAG